MELASISSGEKTGGVKEEEEGVVSVLSNREKHLKGASRLLAISG